MYAGSCIVRVNGNGAAFDFADAAQARAAPLVHSRHVETASGANVQSSVVELRGLGFRTITKD